MPEGPEVETERLHESIHEELHKDGGSFLRNIALTTAVLAAFAAISSLRAGGTVNEALRLQTEATRLQAQASDQWAYYQAKGIKASVTESILESWRAAGKEPPPLAGEKESFSDRAKRYAREQDSIKKEAEKLEHEREAKELEAEHLMHLHHRFAYAVALFQVAIALGAVAALTRRKLVWLGSVGAGLIGVAFFAIALFS
jgi:hypothetical protein